MMAAAALARKLYHPAPVAAPWCTVSRVTQRGGGDGNPNRRRQHRPSHHSRRDLRADCGESAGVAVPVERGREFHLWLQRGSARDNRRDRSHDGAVRHRGRADGLGPSCTRAFAHPADAPQLDVHARVMGAFPGQHGVPVDLRRQRGRSPWPRAVSDLLSGLRNRREPCDGVCGARFAHSRAGRVRRDRRCSRCLPHQVPAEPGARAHDAHDYDGAGVRRAWAMGAAADLRADQRRGRAGWRRRLPGAHRWDSSRAP
jgi:hypothetical protein